MADDTRTRILTAANEQFRRRGFHASSLKEISLAAAAPIGSVYHFFPGGKDELAAAALAAAGATYQQLFEAIADEAADIGAGVSAFFDGAAAVLVETGYLDICPIGTVAAEVASSNDALRLACDRVFGGWIGALAARLVSAGVDAVAADELAVATIAGIEGSFVLARTARRPDPVLAAGRMARAAVDAALRDAALASGGAERRRP